MSAAGNSWNEGRRHTVVAIMTDGHRITIRPLGAHVDVSLSGQKVASSDRAVALDETGLPLGELP